MPESDIKAACVCPKCGHPPRLRFPPHLASYAATLPPHTEMQSYQCPWVLAKGNRCGTTYPIPARALQGVA